MAEDSTVDLEGNSIKSESAPEVEPLQTRLKKIEWDKMGSLYLPLGAIKIEGENGVEIQIDERLKILLADVVAHAVAIFDLLKLYNLRFRINPKEVKNDAVAAIGLTEETEPFLGLNPAMEDDWIAYLCSVPDADRLKKVIKEKNLESVTDQEIAEVLFIGFIAHEIYHLRQYYQDFDYFLDGVKDNILGMTGNAADLFENYDLSQSERSARAFAIKYLLKLIAKLKDFNFLSVRIDLLECLAKVLTDREKVFSENAKVYKEAKSKAKAEADARHAFEQIMLIFPYLHEDDRQSVLDRLRASGVDVSPLLALPLKK